MIGAVLTLADDVVEVRVDGNNVIFRTGIMPMWATIDGLSLSYEGVIREFPDLKDEINWKKIATERFKDKIRSFKTEDEKLNYVIEDLKKHGYKPKLKQKAGFRPSMIQ